MPDQSPHNPIVYVVLAAIILLLLAWRLRRLTQARRLRLEWLWVLPTIFLIVTILSLAPQPPQGLDWAWLGGAFVAGAAIGWWRGKMMHITVDPETHALNVRASPAALFFLVFVVAARVGLRSLAMDEAGTWHLSVAVITGAFLTFAVGALGVQRIEMAMRASRLLAEARAAKARALAAEKA